jgi:phosphate transport system permease protein
MGVEAGTPSTGAAPGPIPLGAARRRWGEEVIRGLLFLAALISILITVGIVFALVEESVSFFGEVGTRFFTDSKWSPLFADPQYGIWQLLNGTFLVTGIAVLVAVPLGLGSAVYLSEYASARVRRIAKPILEVLVGVPTIVFGFFALQFVTPDLLQGVFNLKIQFFNALAAGLMVGIMIVPTIASISEDSMRAVPQGLREGAFGMGATKRQVATKVIFPAAISGIVASIVLGISRAIGETMIVLIAGGLQTNSGLNPTEPFATITTFMGATAKGDNPVGTIGYESIFACGLTLFALTLVMNMIAIRFVRKYREVYD